MRGVARLPPSPYGGELLLFCSVLLENQAFEDYHFLTLVRSDYTGHGDTPVEFLPMHSGLPIGSDSHVKFSLQSKNDLYVNFENALFRDPGDPMRFSYPADHALTAEFDDQTTRLLREYKGDGEYLSVHHPDEPDAKDDAPDSTALALFGAAGGGIGDILFG